MNVSMMASAAKTPSVHGLTLLDHDIDGWMVAMICALVAAVIYELAMALTRTVTLRIPFLILQIARVSVRKDFRAYLYEGWKAELWSILKDPKKGWLRRFWKGMSYAAQLAAFGARATVKVKAEAEVKGRLEKAEQPKKTPLAVTLFDSPLFLPVVTGAFMALSLAILFFVILALQAGMGNGLAVGLMVFITSLMFSFAFVARRISKIRSADKM
ncbi:hypothetical protein [Streptomyces sp. Root369]|uniref:hypothetical protein n=1 Tax=Streptomyces sp. Root369 TaxID=1736523 RepID=UPI00130131F0|nr:hypothetical protein [Streptomyces sp. Root369]